MMSATPPLSATSLRLRSRLRVGLATITLLLVGVVSWQAYYAYLTQKTAAARQSASFVHAIEAHVSHSVEMVDLSLSGFAQLIGAMPSAKRESAEAIQTLLLSQRGAISPNFWILYINAEGAAVAGTGAAPLEGIDKSRRDYFKAHQAVDHGRFIGGPMMASGVKDPAFSVSRRVQGQDGEFLGVVVALMKASAIAQVFESARFNQDVSIALIHTNGRVIARAPFFERSFGADVTGIELFQRIRDAPVGGYEARSVVDDETRIYSYRRLDDLPLIVSVGISSDVWEGALYRSIAFGATGSLLILGILLLSARATLRSYARLEQSEARFRSLYAEVQAAEQKLQANEKRLRTITDNIPAMITYVDRDHKLQFYNRTFMEWRSLPETQTPGQPLVEVVGATLYEDRRANIERALAGESLSFEFESLIQGQMRHLQIIYIPDRLEDGTVAGIYTLSTDITGLKEKEQALDALARFDPLTGLANRRELNARLENAIKRGRRSGKPLALLFLDVDNFKSINDQRGHAAGDTVLQQFSQRLTANVRATDTVSRLAGDEFVIVLEDISAATDAELVAAKIIDALRQPMRIGTTDLSITISIGVCFSRSYEVSAAELLAHADDALYQAKATGRDAYIVKEC